MKSLSLQQISRIDLHPTLQLLIGICFLLDYWLSVISKVFVADLSMCLLAGKDITQKLAVLILKHLAQQTSTY